MTLAIVIVIAAVLALVLILRIAVSRSLQISAGPNLLAQIQPIDVEAFRNLVNPAEDAFLRRRLPASRFRQVRRARPAGNFRIRAGGRKKTRLCWCALARSRFGHRRSQNRECCASAGETTRSCCVAIATFALIGIHMALAWPNSGLAAVPVIDGYGRLSSSAMLLGRLQHPAIPVRLAAH